MAETQLSPVPKKSDLSTRAASAVVMVAVAGTALWLGGWWWTVFVAAVALGVLWEWTQLVSKLSNNRLAYLCWIIGGLIYVGLAALFLVSQRTRADFDISVLAIVGAVVAVDIGAYFAGRTFGGPKIAPAISPSKTWAGLAGGIIAATSVVFWTISALGLCYYDGPPVWFPCLQFGWAEFLFSFVLGAGVAIVAQAGDFFESWMKRKAGVKDSGDLVPGHGGLFDRTDGLLAVCFVIGLLWLPAHFMSS